MLIIYASYFVFTLSISRHLQEASILLSAQEHPGIILYVYRALEKRARNECYLLLPSCITVRLYLYLVHLAEST